MNGESDKAPSGNSDVAPAAPSKSAWPAFLAAHGALLRRIEARFAEAGLPEFGWYDVLWALETAPDSRLRMAELADAAVIARSNLTRLVDRLEKEGFVIRERVASDRRGAYAVLTEAGRALRARMWAVYGPAIEDCFGRYLSAEEDRLLRELMLRLLHAARLPDAGSVAGT